MTSVERKLSKIRKAQKRLNRFFECLTPDGHRFGAVAWLGNDPLVVGDGEHPDHPERAAIQAEGHRLWSFAHPRSVPSAAARRHRVRAMIAAS